MQLADLKHLDQARSLITRLKTTQGNFMVFGYFSRKKQNREIATRIYREIARHARLPGFYLHMGVPDTVMGRFEMISVVMVLFLRRAGKGSEALGQLSEDVVDLFFGELDHSIRELGVGDISVPKRMKKLARMFYGRAEAYSDQLDERNVPGLAQALRRNIHPEGEENDSGLNSSAMLRLAEAVFALDETFARQDEADIVRGELVSLDQPADA